MRVKAPATTANLGPGFDCFGLALAEPFDVVEVERSDSMEISVSGRGADTIPIEPELNTAGVVALEMVEEPVRIGIEKGVRPSSGMGSSAASAAGAALAVNEVFGLGHTREELVRFAAQGEAAVSGAPHADNVAPALLGGFTVIRGDEVVGFDAPETGVAVALPETELSTARAREVLPESVPLGDAVENVASASLLAAGVASGDPELLGRGMRDVVVEPRRKGLIPGFDAAREAALGAGAFGVAISGAGPSVVAVCEDADAVSDAMVDAFGDADVAAEGFSTVPGSGAEAL